MVEREKKREEKETRKRGREESNGNFN